MKFLDAQVDTASVENVATVAENSYIVHPEHKCQLKKVVFCLHFENVVETATRKARFVDLGGVETPSDGNKWPTDTVNFSVAKWMTTAIMSDIKKSETPGTIGYVVLKDGEKITESDQKVELLFRNKMRLGLLAIILFLAMSSLKDENVLLNHNYTCKDNDYDLVVGVWTWGGVLLNTI